MEFTKSPIYYMGNKYDLMKYLNLYFPDEKEIDTFYDMFGGSGTVSLNVKYKNIVYNEKNEEIVNLLKMFIKHTPEEINEHVLNRINEFSLPLYKEQYTREHDKKSYVKFMNYFNNQKERNYLDLYTLSVYSISHMIRFNFNKKFNSSRGNNYYTKDNLIRMQNAYSKLKNITIMQEDAFELLDKINDTKSFVYLDPPYHNSYAFYNEQRFGGGVGI